MAINVTVSKPRMVQDIPAYFPFVIQLNNGDLLVQSLWGQDRQPRPEEYEAFYTFDGPTTEQDWIDYNDKRRELYGKDYVHVLNILVLFWHQIKFWSGHSFRFHWILAAELPETCNSASAIF